jgi:hypothetical protein
MLQKSGLLGATARNLLFCSLVTTIYPYRSPVADRSHAKARAGEWQTKAQLVWDGSEQKLIPRTFRVWDPHPELGSSFPGSSNQARTTDPIGTIAGSGILTWRAKGSASYDRKAVP